MRAVLDEVIPELRQGQLYVVSGVVMFADSPTTEEVRSTIATMGRVRPFHWATEGVSAKSAIIDLLIDSGAIAEVCVCGPIGRRAQEPARAVALREVVRRVVLVEGVTDLTIESRSPRQDARDRSTVLDLLRESGDPGPVNYEWADKNEPALWLADAVCGAVSSFLTGADPSWMDRLRRGRVVAGEPTYLASPPVS